MYIQHEVYVLNTVNLVPNFLSVLYNFETILSLMFFVCVFQDVGLALRTLLATVDETLPQLPASTHREVTTHTH